MSNFTEEELLELDAICKEITILKLKRIEKFGKKWQNVLLRGNNTKREKSKIESNVIEKHLRNIDEVMALKNYTKGKLLGKLNLSRNVYFDLTNGHISNRVNKILNNTDWINL